MNRALAVLALVLLGCCPTTQPAPAAPSPSTVVNVEYQRAVRVDVDCGLGLTPNGTGVRVGGHTVLTALHVVQCDVKSVAVVDQDGKSYEAKVQGAAPFDVARLEAKDLPALPQLEIGSVDVGSRACAAVYLPERGRRCGEVWPNIEGQDSGWMHVDFVAEHGNSGAGVWDEEGRLVGILVHLRWCKGTEDNGQVCTAGVTPLAGRSWIAAE